MKSKCIFSFVSFLLVFVLWNPIKSLSQNNTLSSGSWSDVTLWSRGNTPLPTHNVIVNHPVVIETNISIDGGAYEFNRDVINLAVPNAPIVSLTAAGNSSLLIASGTTRLRGSINLSGSSLTIKAGAVLITGSVSLGNRNTIVIESGATWIVNGNFLNSNSSGHVVVDGLLKISGDYDTSNGNLDIVGIGDLYTTGKLFNQGSSSVFGSSNDCNAGPCSGRNLCSFNNAIQSDQVICEGNNSMPIVSTTFGSPASSATLVYAWEYSTTSNIAGFSPAPGVGNMETYSPGVLKQSAWFRRRVTSGGCTGYSVPVELKVQSGGGWRGITSDWDTPSNWCNGAVPSATTDVVISAGAGVPNQPVVGNTASCRELMVCPGAVLSLSSSGSFDVYGDLFNNGTLNITNGTVSFNGSVTQNVSGDPIQFYNLTINNSSPNTVVFKTFASVFNQLTMSQGNVNMSGYNLTLGTSRTNPGSLSRTAGTIYNGSLTRWFKPSAITIGASTGLFPVGTARDYRPFYLGYIALVGTGASGGSVKISHIDAPTTSAVSFLDIINVVQRRTDARWVVSAANGFNQGLSITPVTTRVEGTGFGMVGDVNDLRLTLSNSTIALPGINSGTLINPQINRTSLLLSELNNTFYVGSINAAQSPLPIRLIGFAGKSVNGKIELDWSTSSEINFDHFLLERSVDGINFESVTRMVGEGGYNRYTSYSYTDDALPLGTYYYRLKSIDLDESFEYSKVIAVVLSDNPWEESISVYPNPVLNGKFKIRVNEPIASGQFFLSDQYGRTIINGRLVEGEQEININNRLNSGIYFIRIEGINKTIKLVVKN